VRRHIITLSVPVEDDEIDPDQWDWQEIIDTDRRVTVLRCREHLRVVKNPKKRRVTTKSTPPDASA